MLLGNFVIFIGFSVVEKRFWNFGHHFAKPLFLALMLLDVGLCSPVSFYLHAWCESWKVCNCRFVIQNIQIYLFLTRARLLLVQEQILIFFPITALSLELQTKSLPLLYAVLQTWNPVYNIKQVVCHYYLVWLYIFTVWEMAFSLKTEPCGWAV